MHAAELIAEVPPLSGWNIDGRTIARPIDEFIATAERLNWHQWNPFRNVSQDGDYGRDCPIDRFAIAAGEPPLPRGTGLYVHTAARNEDVYYAVLARVDGVENTRDVGPANALPHPVREAAARRAAIEGSKDALSLLWRDARPRVAHADPNLRLFHPRAQADPSARRRADRTARTRSWADRSAGRPRG